VGVGGLFQQQRLLSWLVHARMELCQAIPHLFPQLERTFREQELKRSMDERGHVNFRSALPDGPTSHSFHPASDGQLGGIMKVYREWQISGDKDWLCEMYPLAKCSMDFCIQYWDPDHQGVLMEPHHNITTLNFGGRTACAAVSTWERWPAWPRWRRMPAIPKRPVFTKSWQEGRGLPGHATVQRGILRAKGDAEGPARLAFRGRSEKSAGK